MLIQLNNSNANVTILINEAKEPVVWEPWEHTQWFMAKQTTKLNAFSSKGTFFNTTIAPINDSAFYHCTCWENISLFWWSNVAIQDFNLGNLSTKKNDNMMENTAIKWKYLAVIFVMVNSM